jgi:hypothetical protein
MKYWILFLLVLVNVYSVEFEVIQETGDSRNRYDLVFIGDRYFEGEMQEYAEDVNDIWFGLIKDYAFWNRYKNFFNVYRLDAISVESNPEEIRDPGNSYLGLDFIKGIRVGWSQMWNRNLELFNQLGVGHDSTIILTKRGYNLGTALMFPGKDHIGVGISVSFPKLSIVNHEMGHILSLAADEYLNQSNFLTMRAPNFAKTAEIAYEKWGHWIGYTDPYTKFEIKEPFKRKGTNYFVPTESNGIMHHDNTGDFHAVNREKMILGMYNWLNPIDSFTENNTTITSDTILEINVIDPEVISVAWILDDQIISRSNTLELEKFNLKEGSIVYGCAWDTTLNSDYKTNDRGGWVRKDDDNLTYQIMSWGISNQKKPYLGSNNPNILKILLDSTIVTEFIKSDNPDNEVLNKNNKIIEQVETKELNVEIEELKIQIERKLEELKIQIESKNEKFISSRFYNSLVKINENNWVDAGFFGILCIFDNGWGYHVKHGWIYIAEDSENSALWFWSESKEDWMWANEEFRSYFYSNNLKDWIYIN